jgi:hypothetical protein
MGILLALLILLQAGSGLLLTFGERLETHQHAHANAVSIHNGENHHRDDADVELTDKQHGLAGVIHHGSGTIGRAYRYVVGFGMIGMVLSGSLIYLKTRIRAKRH